VRAVWLGWLVLLVSSAVAAALTAAPMRMTRVMIVAVAPARIFIHYVPMW
jgi:hypothetical protein